MPKTISIIVPVYNEETYIKQAYEKIANADTLHLAKEIIFINDGSTDGSSSVLQNYSKIKNVKIISILKNEGKGAAVKEGINASSGDIVIIQDVDLEYDPADYPVILEPFIKYQADVVYGSRFISNRPHRILYFWHYMGNVLLTTFSNMLSNLNLTDMETGYKAFRGDLIRKIAPRLESKRFGFEPEVTARIAKNKSLRIYEVGISYTGRTYLEGKKIGWKDGVFALWEIVKYNLLST